MCLSIRNAADRRFRRQCQIATGISLILYMAFSQASIRTHNGPAGLTMAGIAGASFFAELVSVGLLVTRLRDEFQRVLLTRSFVWATLITMALTTIWGFVELHAPRTVPHLNVIWIPMILLVVTAGAKLFIFRQYRPENE
ncbi:MAG: hypothetical protein WBG54_12490 [Acidobacteriaceae bacterium]